MKTILVLEDEKLLADAAKLKLANKGLQVITVRTVEEASEILKTKTNIDLFWLDHYLPETNANVFFNEVKKDDSIYKNVPTVLVTGESDTQSIQEYINKGLTKYYVKSKSTLSEIIEGILECLTNTK
ncbi:MAG: response regulator [Patescibacteria group bacterium]